MQSSISIPFTTSAPGDFTLVHNLGMTPNTVIIELTSGGGIWFQSIRFDETNLYLVASDSGLTGEVTVFASCGC